MPLEKALGSERTPFSWTVLPSHSSHDRPWSSVVTRWYRLLFARLKT